jgi:hypothetical protein
MALKLILGKLREDEWLEFMLYHVLRPEQLEGVSVQRKGAKTQSVNDRFESELTTHIAQQPVKLDHITKPNFASSRLLRFALDVFCMKSGTFLLPFCLKMRYLERTPGMNRINTSRRFAGPHT